MNKIVSKVVKTLKRIKGYFPSKLPVGVQEFDKYFQDLLFVYDLPDAPSYKQAVASMIMHLGPTTYYKPAYFFALSIKKAMANQIAYSVIQQIREDEKKGEVTPEKQLTKNEPIQDQGV